MSTRNKNAAGNQLDTADQDNQPETADQPEQERPAPPPKGSREDLEIQLSAARGRLTDTRQGIAAAKAKHEKNLSQADELRKALLRVDQEVHSSHYERLTNQEATDMSLVSRLEMELASISSSSKPIGA